MNLLEQTILNEIANAHQNEYPFIKDHLPFIRVKSREKSDAGMYVNFMYTKDFKHSKQPKQADIYLTSNKSLELDNLDYGLNHELNITNGKLDFLELVTNGEYWDGSYKSFSFD